MSLSAKELGRQTLERLRDEFQAKGYSFIIDPRDDQVPDFLHAFEPDAIAIRSEDKVIIEVKGRRQTDPKVPIVQLAKEIPPKSGWRYLLIYEGQDPNDFVALSRPQKYQIDQAIKEARSLEESGHARAAFIEGWSLLEALARRLYTEDIRVSLRPLSPMQIVERMAMDGQIGDPDARRLRTLISVRNSIVHGDLNVNVSKEDVDFILKKIETINARLAH